MIVSHKYRFIFIKTLKTAGTSVEVFLSDHCSEDDIVTPVFPPEKSHVPRNHKGLWNPVYDLIEKDGRGIRRAARDLLARRKFYNHIPARILRHRLPSDVWNNYFKFCIERNPWDKTLSHFHMVRERTGGVLTFDEYLASGKFCFNHPIYLDNNGDLLVDRVIRYESLSDELAEVFSMLDVPYDGKLGVQAKSEHRRDKRPYTEVYSEASRKIVENAFRTEIRLHDYQF
ncbi:hypothetical protein SAMN05216203_1604 [Marinobacter daqiaonensis]|uniref:Sulfotransferase family protein n=1 Tax=Marinobacter daqiaonensis TaxID=650891 RepID=A0A1I6HW77_9GAMM|nr:hypothetical protein [Marinobacter daqiaonensis]SFR58684.1 hypothetical protein SAMN05216203_1604 [Marinobacter daqiaonensis]